MRILWCAPRACSYEMLPTLCLLAAFPHNKLNAWAKQALHLETRHWKEHEPYDVHSYAAVGRGRKTVDWSGSIFQRAWQRCTGALTEFAFTGTTMSWTYWLRAWCHGTTFLLWPEGKMSVLRKTVYPHFRLKELHVVQPDRLIHCMTFQLSTWG